MPTKGDHPCDGFVRLLLHAEHQQDRLGGNRLDAFDLKKPIVVAVFWEDYHHPFFVISFVKLFHQWVLLRIDSDHGETMLFDPMRRLPPCPKPSNTHR